MRLEVKVACSNNINGNLKFIQLGECFPHPPESALRSLQRLIAEIEGTAVMGLQNEEPHGHR